MSDYAEIIESGPVPVLREIRTILIAASGSGRALNTREANILLDLACGAVANAECGAYDAPPPVGVTPPAIGAALALVLELARENIIAEGDAEGDDSLADSREAQIAACDLIETLGAAGASPSPMAALIAEALAYEAHAFDNDECMDLADLCTWFGQWRTRVKAAL